MANGQQHAFLYSNGVMTDLGTLAGTDSNFTDINEAGQVVWDSYGANGQTHVFLYSNGVITDIGASFDGNSYAADINEAGQVVGKLSMSNRSYGFIYDAENGLRSVNSLLPPDSGWDVQSVVEINEMGQMAVEGVIGINRHAALISGVTAPSPTPTPSPSPTPTPTMHIGDLDGVRTNQKGSWTASVTVMVHNANHGPVANVTVSGSWSIGGTGSCTTDGSGQCLLSRATISRKTQSVTLTNFNVTKSPYLYRQVDNHDPDGDSNGTNITVRSP